MTFGTLEVVLMVVVLPRCDNVDMPVSEDRGGRERDRLAMDAWQ